MVTWKGITETILSCAAQPDGGIRSPLINRSLGGTLALDDLMERLAEELNNSLRLMSCEQRNESMPREEID